MISATQYQFALTWRCRYPGRGPVQVLCRRVPMAPQWLDRVAQGTPPSGPGTRPDRRRADCITEARAVAVEGDAAFVHKRLFMSQEI
jgi:hypothetical protein